MSLTTKKSEIPWVEKYRPKSVSEMALPSAKVNNNKVNLAEDLKQFIAEFFKEIENINAENKKIRLHNRNCEEKDQKEELRLPPDKAAVLLEGPPGIGKTTIVYALANDLNMEVIETNASDTRTRNTIEAKLKETVKSRGIMDYITVTKKKLVLIDEIDGIYGVTDRGAVPTVIELIETTQFPIFLCANEYKQNLQPLYNKIKRYEINPLSKKEVIKIVKKIMTKEKITGLTEDDLNLIVDKNNGDLRGVINDLQGISQGDLEKSNKELIMKLYRDSTEEIFSVIRDLFQKPQSLKDARNITDKSDVDYNFLYKWVHENLPTFIKLNTELDSAYENLSLADEIFGRIRRNQYWSLLPYFYDLFTGGVVLSRKERSPKEGFRRIVFPRYSSSSLFSLSSTESIVIEKIQEKYNISAYEIIQDLLPFLKNYCSSSRRAFKEVSDWLELDANEKKMLK